MASTASTNHSYVAVCYPGSHQRASPSPQSAGLVRTFLRERFDCRRWLVLHCGVVRSFAAAAVGEAHGCPSADGSSARSDEATGESSPSVPVRPLSAQTSMADGSALTWALRPATTLVLITTVAEWRCLDARFAVKRYRPQGAREGPKSVTENTAQGMLFIATAERQYLSKPSQGVQNPHKKKTNETVRPFRYTSYVLSFDRSVYENTSIPQV